MSGGRRGEHAEAGGGRGTEWRPLAAPCRFGHAAALFFAELRGPGLAHLAVLERSSGSRARGRESQEWSQKSEGPSAGKRQWLSPTPIQERWQEGGIPQGGEWEAGGNPPTPPPPFSNKEPRSQTEREKDFASSYSGSSVSLWRWC